MQVKTLNQVSYFVLFVLFSLTMIWQDSTNRLKKNFNIILEHRMFSWEFKLFIFTCLFFQEAQTAKQAALN